MGPRIDRAARTVQNFDSAAVDSKVVDYSHEYISKIRSYIDDLRFYTVE
jgi:hypothetical protein